MKILKSLIILLFLNLYTYAEPQILWFVTNSDTVYKYAKFEISLDIIATYSNPFNEQEISIIAEIKSPTQKNFNVTGFYYQDYQRTGPPETLAVAGNPFWKIRFTPTEIGQWTYKVIIKDGTGTTTTAEKNFEVIPSDKNGFIRKANNRYLKYDDSSPFFAIGENMIFYNLPNKTYDYQNWIDKLSENKANFIRVWMASKSFAIEWTGTPLGDYRTRMDRAYQLDWLLDYCDQKNVAVQLCLYSHGMFSTVIDSEWSYNPYNAAQGGPLDFPYQFFNNSDAKKFDQIKMKYIMARWGYSTKILAYELFNEVDHVDSFYVFKNRITTWLNETAKFIKQNDIYQHLVTNSYWNEFLDEEVWTSDYIDLSQTHHYNETSDVQSLHYFYTQMKTNDYSKPSIIGEFDFTKLGSWAALNDPNGIDFHNSLWSSALSGAYGTALTWSWDSFIDFRNLYYHFKGLSTFISGINFVTENFIPIIPISHSTQKADFSISPAYTKYGKSPQNLFQVSSEGFVSPSSMYLSKYLFGSVANTELRNPPVFYIDYDIPGEFKVVCGNDSAISPRIKISVNGNTKLDQPASINSTYSVNLSQGSQQVKVDNSGFDWIKINEFIVSNYVSAIKSYALRGDSVIIGWATNRNYNWKYIRDFGTEPDAIPDGKITIFGLKTDGYYKIEWFDCYENNFIKKDIALSANSNLTINVPSFIWDISYKISYIGATYLLDNNLSFKDFKLYQNYPNPFNSGSVIRFTVAENSRVIIKIFDILGRELYTLLDKDMSPGEYKSQFDTQKLNLSSGIYFYRMEAKDKVFLKKMVLMK